MTPPSLTVAREILADAAAKARTSGDPVAELAAAAIDVALAEIDRRPAPMEPMPALEPRGGAARCQQNYGAIQCQHDAGHAGDHVSFQLGSRRVWSDVQLDTLQRDHGAITVEALARARAENEGLRATIDAQEKLRAGLMIYIEDAVQACGDERVSGEPLAQAIRRMRDELVKLRSQGASVHGAASAITVSNPPAGTAPTAILIASIPGVRQIRSREDARAAFGRRDGDAVWDAFGRAAPPVFVQIDPSNALTPAEIAELEDGAVIEVDFIDHGRETGAPFRHRNRFVVQRHDGIPCAHRAPADPEHLGSLLELQPTTIVRRVATAGPTTAADPAPATRGPGPMSRAERAAALRADADRIERAEPAAVTTHGTVIPPEATADTMLPCPFCRCATITVGAGPFETLWRAVCAECGASGPLAKSAGSREAIANWNRRPQDCAPGERYLAAALRQLIVDLGVAPSGTGSEDLGILEVEIKRLRAGRAPVIVFEGRDGRARGDVSDVVASCEASRLVTIRDFMLIDEPPGISVGYVVNAEQVKALRARAEEQRAIAQEPPLGARVRVTAGEHAGFVGTVQPRDENDPPGWSRVRRDLGARETRLFESRHLAPAEESSR